MLRLHSTRSIRDSRHQGANLTSLLLPFARTPPRARGGVRRFSLRFGPFSLRPPKAPEARLGRFCRFGRDVEPAALRGKPPLLPAFDDPTTSTTSTTLRRKAHPPPSAFRARKGISEPVCTLRLRPSARGSSTSSASSMSSNRPPCGGISPLPRPAPAEDQARICCIFVAFARPGFVVDSSPARAQRAKHPSMPRHSHRPLSDSGRPRRPVRFPIPIPVCPCFLRAGGV